MKCPNCGETLECSACGAEIDTPERAIPSERESELLAELRALRVQLAEMKQTAPPPESEELPEDGESEAEAEAAAADERARKAVESDWGDGW